MHSYTILYFYVFRIGLKHHCTASTLLPVYLHTSTLHHHLFDEIHLYIIEMFVRAHATNHSSISRRCINHVLIDILSMVFINTIMARIGRHLHPLHATLLIDRWWICFANFYVKLLLVVRLIFHCGNIWTAGASIFVFTKTDAKLWISQKFQSIFSNRTERG